MSALQTVTIGYGKANFDTNSMTLLAVTVAENFARLTPEKTFKRLGSTAVFPTSNRPDASGNMYQARYDMPDGVILMFQASRRYRGAGAGDAAFFFRTRIDGPYIMVDATIPANRMNTLGNSHLCLSARGDVLDPSELAAYGVRVPDRFAATYFNADEIAEAFDAREIAPGTERPQMESFVLSSGETVLVETAPTPRRRMRLAR